MSKLKGFVTFPEINLNAKTKGEKSFGKILIN